MYFVSSVQNRSNEDFYFIYTTEYCVMYAVIDGHAGGNKNKKKLHGSHTALYVCEHLADYVLTELDGMEFSSDEIPQAIKNAFVKLDRDLYDRNSTAGCTCNFIIDTGTHVIICNLGDSRTIIVDEDMNIVFETKDHKPEDERDRINDASGFVNIHTSRLNGIYALSRSFGDFDVKLIDDKYSPEGPMSCIPDVTVLEKKNKYTAILGTDGIYDGFESSKEVVDMLKTSKTNPSRHIVNYAKDKNGEDDATCIVAFL